jgi:hypothetical protein
MKKTTKLPEKRRRLAPRRCLVLYRVWVEQVNQTYVDVRAADEEDAREKGYRKWRRECAGARVLGVELQEPTTATKGS